MPSHGVALINGHPEMQIVLEILREQGPLSVAEIFRDPRLKPWCEKNTRKNIMLRLKNAGYVKAIYERSGVSATWKLI